MQIRHRIPTIFTLYMVDVLCCALGCVILLWQVNFHEAEEQTANAKDANLKIAKIKEESGKQISDLEGSLSALKANSGKKISDLERSLTAAHLSLKDSEFQSAKRIEEMLAKLKTSEANSIARILSLDELIAGLRTDLKDAAKRETGLQLSLKTKTKDFTFLELTSAKEIKELLASLKTSQDKEKLANAKIETLDQLYAAIKADLAKSKKNEANARVEVATLSKTVDFFKGELKFSKDNEKKIALEVADLRNKLDKTNDFALLTRKDYDDAKKALAAAQIVLNGIRVDFDKLKIEKTKTTAELALKMKEQEKILRDLKGADLTITVLRRDLADRLRQHQNAVLVAEDLTKKLKDAETNAKKLEQTLAGLQLLSKDYLSQMKTSDIRAQLLEKDIEKSKKDILEAARRYQDLIALQELVVKRLKLNDKDLEEARKTIANLQGDRLSLILQAKVLRDVADNRFAGIPLTGQNVIFLIDMSGSMEMIDSKKLDPEKWPFLCEQVVKIMKSLPEIKQYQVIMFSDKVRYPFGRKGEWLPYNPKETPQTVLKGLRAVKPVDETNMYDAFEDAFAYRAKKLDTIYMFSDGLPNAGKGLAAEDAKLTDQQQSEILGRYIRNRLKNVWNAPVKGQPKVRINTIGFFFESPDVGAFLWALAREHEGSFVGIR